MPLLLAVEDVVARVDTLRDPIDEEIEDRLVEALEIPDEMLAPGTRELDALELGICDVDE